MKLVAYTRLSQANAHEEESHEGQLARIAAWADEHGHEIVGHRPDTISGENGIAKRKELAVAFDRLDAGDADGLVFAQLDRLSRDVIVQESILRDVWASGHEAFSATPGEANLRDDPDDPSRRLIRVVMGAVAEYERAMIVLRMKRGRRRAIRTGKIVGGGSWKLAYGWTRDEHDRPVPKPGEIEHVRHAVELRGADHSLRDIAEYLASVSGRAWHPTQVQRVLDRFEKWGGG